MPKISKSKNLEWKSTISTVLSLGIKITSINYVTLIANQFHKTNVNK